MNKAFFFDRDGVINHSNLIDGKPHAPLFFQDFKLLPGIFSIMTFLKNEGFLIIVITNQPNLSPKRKTLKISELDKMHKSILNMLPIDHIYVCPHTTEENCNCKKPKIGNILKAADDFSINLSKSFMVGDRWVDVECAMNANLKGCFYLDYKYNEKKPNLNFCNKIDNILEIKKYQNFF